MIVITTPTGDIGHQVLENLLSSNEQIRVIVRDPSRIPAEVRNRIQIVQGSHGDASICNTAFAGADALFWVLPPDFAANSVEAAYLDFSRPACEGIRKRGVKQVVIVSALGRGTPQAKKAGLVTASLAMEDLFASTGVNLRVLTMPSFMDNLLNQAEAIKTRGMIFSPISGDRKLPHCATRDIAAAAAKLLLDRTWTGQKEVPVLGPEDLSFNDIAQIIPEVLGKPVRFQQIPGEAFKSRLMEFGMSDAMAQGMLDMMVAKNDGLDNAAPRTPETTSPTTFREWCEEVLEPACSLQEASTK